MNLVGININNLSGSSNGYGFIYSSCSIFFVIRFVSPSSISNVFTFHCRNVCLVGAPLIASVLNSDDELP